MRQIKRLDRRPTNRFERLGRGALRFATLSEERLREIEASTPDLIIEDQDSLLIGELAGGSIDLQYSFPGNDAFHERFPPMFEKIVRSCSGVDAPFGYRLRLTERSSRPYVEPILTSLAFELSREWMLMELLSIPQTAAAGDEIAPGFVLRAAGRNDAAAIIELEERTFPNPQLTPDAVADSMRTATFYRVLEERANGRIVGSLMGELRGYGTGHIAVLDVHPDYQRRGLGLAIMNWALAQLADRSMHRVTLRTSIDNAPAIALYRKLGFAAKQIGLDYRRPIDEDEVRQIMEKNRAEHLSMRPRWSLR